MTPTEQDKKLREQIEIHVRDAMGDIPTPHLLEWHTDVFMQVITDEVERRIAELKAQQEELEECTK